MASPLRQKVPLRELAERGQSFDIKEKVAEYPRLVEIVHADLADAESAEQGANWHENPVEIALEFGWADERPGVPALEGRATTRIPATCQRCLEPFELDLDTTFRLLLAEPESAVSEAPGYELWEVDSEAEAGDLVEEALIMALPFAAMHGDDVECEGREEVAADVEEDTVRPFADLRSMMAADE